MLSKVTYSYSGNRFRQNQHSIVVFAIIRIKSLYEADLEILSDTSACFFKLPFFLRSPVCAFFCVFSWRTSFFQIFPCKTPHYPTCLIYRLYMLQSRRSRLCVFSHPPVFHATNYQDLPVRLSLPEHLCRL